MFVRDLTEVEEIYIGNKPEQHDFDRFTDI